MAGPEVADDLGYIFVVEQRLPDAGVEYPRQSLAGEESPPSRLELAEQLPHRQAAAEGQKRRSAEAAADRAADLCRDANVDLHPPRDLGVAPHPFADPQDLRRAAQEIEPAPVDADHDAFDRSTVLKPKDQFSRG